MSGSKEANFDELMRRFQDCASAETRGAMNLLHVDCSRFYTLMQNRMNLLPDGYNNLKGRVCNDNDTFVHGFIDNEPYFAGLYEMGDNWINFINEMRKLVRPPPVPVPAYVPARAPVAYAPVPARAPVAYVPVPAPVPARAPVSAYVPVPDEQVVASHDEQDASRALEAAVSPTHDREMPIESNVYGPMQLWPQVHELLHDVLLNIFTSGGGVESIYAQQCNWMIGQVLDKPPSLTPEQLNAIHGAPGMPMVPVLDLKLIFKEAHPQLDDDAAFDYACMAYFVGDPSARERVENYFITIPPALNAFVEQFNNPAQIEVYRMWKRCFMIAQLMYSLTQIVHYDRSGVYADARKRLGSRSIPRGGKSHSKRSKRSNSKRSNSKRSNSKRRNSKRSNSKHSNSKRSKRSKRSSRR